MRLVLRIAYLTNQYPATSHTFIRREIVALEERGHVISRYTIREASTKLNDPADLDELEKTDHVLGIGPLAMLCMAAAEIVSKPIRFWNAVRCSGQFLACNRSALRQIAYLVEALVVSRWCRRDRIEHLHVHFGSNPATVGTLVSVLTGIPFSLTVHGPDEFDNPIAHGLALKVAKASFAVAISSFGRSQLMRWTDQRHWNKIEVVHCGLDRAYTAEPGTLATDSRRLLCVARLAEQKGHMILLRAAKKLRSEGVAFDLQLIGDGPLRPLVEQTIQRFGLGQCVRVVGWLPQAQVQSEIRSSRATVLPSFAEGLPVVLMESLALRKPVISTFIAGIPELVEPANGWLVPAGDVEMLCAAMRAALAADPAALEAMGEQGRRRVLARHDIAHSALLMERHILAATMTRPRRVPQNVGSSVPVRAKAVTDKIR